MAYSSPCRPHAVEHVCTEGHRYHQVLGVAYAHDISRLLLRQQTSAGIHHLAVIALCLASRQATNGYPWCISGDHLSSALPPQVEIQSSLYDAKEVLALWVLVCLY